MSKIVITTDSGIDPINTENMIPGQIVENDRTCYRDMIDITPVEILEKTKLGSKFKTASPILLDYGNKFEQLLKENDEIIHLSMSSGISEGSVISSKLMASDLDCERIHVIDTLTGATGGTLINEIANNLVNEGYETKEIIKILNDIKSRIHTSFYVPNPEGFIRSGRNKSELCLKDKALLMGAKASVVAGIKFRVDFNNEGNLYTKGIIRKKTSQGMLKIVEEVINEDNKNLFENDYVVIGNVNEDKVDMQELRNYLESLNYFKSIIRKDINGVVACYGSNDLCGISLVKKR
jgi:DegV family protein with EDD domain